MPRQRCFMVPAIEQRRCRASHLS